MAVDRQRVSLSDVEEISGQVIEEKIYVAVGKEVGESKQTLTWTLHNSGGKRVCILHVHQPAQRIPAMGAKFSVDQAGEHEVRVHREKEKKEMNKILRDYTMVCERAGVQADVITIEMDSIEKGIIELISQHNIRKLVMGAAADKSYSKKMFEPRSKKAIYVRLQVPDSCQIMFICKGNLVHTRERISQKISPDLGLIINHATLISEVGAASRSQSYKLAQSDQLGVLKQDIRRVKSEINHVKISPFSPSSSEEISPQIRLNRINSYCGWDESPTTSSSLHSRSSSDFARGIASGIASTFAVNTGNGLESSAKDRLKDTYQHTSPSVLENGLNDKLYDQLRQAYADSENSKREAFEESMRRSKAEKEAIDAFRKAKTLEALLAEEVRQRKETEEAFKRGNEEIYNMKLQLQKYKKERDELQVERDNALKSAEELREKQAKDVSDFSYSEIKEATDSFDLSMKIGEGSYGNVYRGLVRHTQVAIKMLHSDSFQGPAEFQQEVSILTKLRHPNLVNLIGACPEACILVYEFYPNGSLEDRLSCKDNTPPLSWKVRIRIAAEVCSALIFLHSCSPHSIVHGDLKPANILLDAHWVSKLSDFGISRFIYGNEFSRNNSTPCRLTEPKGTWVYLDPEFLQTGELTVQSDVYSFGIILLRLLTGRPALGITKDLHSALQKGNLEEFLDSKAGEWPFMQAKQLAQLAMRCCEPLRQARPNLVSEVWRVLEPMRLSSERFQRNNLRSSSSC